MIEDLILQLASVVAATLRVATPLIFAALGGLLSERAGIIDIGLEGKMLAAAFAAAATGYLTGSLWMALAAALMVSLIMAIIHAIASICVGGDQVVSGVALNILAAGLTVTLGNAWFKGGGQTPELPAALRFTPLEFPFVALVEKIPLFGPALVTAFLQHNALVYLALILVALLGFVLLRTRFGLHLRAVGENPQIVDTAGINVFRLQIVALLGCGFLCGLAGIYLALAQNAAFTPHMTAGRGFMALAALIFGNWRPWPTLGACLLFGLLDALAIRLEGIAVFGSWTVPTEAIQALPYLLTVGLLAGFVGRSQPPAALGKAYVRENHS